MSRLSLVAAAALAAMVSPALAPASARADDCMCIVAPMLRAGGEMRVLQSMEVGPFFSSDGATLTSDLPEPEAPRAERRRESNEGILWCVSADDPRCSPRDGAPTDGPGSLEASHVASTTPAHPRLGPPASGGMRPRHAEDGERRGVRDRVERPPAR